VSFWPVNKALRVAVAIAEIFVVKPLVIVFFPLSGGILYLIFWLATSRATVFLHQEGDEVVAKGDLWLVQLQQGRREAHIKELRQIKERGFLGRHVASARQLPGISGLMGGIPALVFPDRFNRS
jgi:hypothetical protein